MPADSSCRRRWRTTSRKYSGSSASQTYLMEIESPKATSAATSQPRVSQDREAAKENIAEEVVGGQGGQQHEREAEHSRSPERQRDPPLVVGRPAPPARHAALVRIRSQSPARAQSGACHGDDQRRHT